MNRNQFLSPLYTNAQHDANMLLLNDKDTVLQVNLLREVHFTRDGGEDEAFLSAVGQRELNLSVQTARTQEGGVQRVSPVGGHDHLRGSSNVSKGHMSMKKKWLRYGMNLPLYLMCSQMF